MCPLDQRFFPYGIIQASRMKLSRQKFADRFGLDPRAVQDWEQGRPVFQRPRILLCRTTAPIFNYVLDVIYSRA